MNYLFDKTTNVLVAFSENDLSDQTGDLYVLHADSVEIDSTDISGYSLVDGVIVYKETEDHKNIMKVRDEFKTNQELLAMIEELKLQIASQG